MATRTRKPVTVSCPQCGKPVVWDPANSYRPFCSERCKLIDLGQWAEEKYRIPDEEKDEGGSRKDKEKF